MITALTKPVRNLVLVMLVVVITGVIIARSYYGNINRSVDPRIIHARELYSKYDRVAGSGNFYAVFELLDSIELIYNATEHYRSSFEMGVIENNKAAALLTIALYGDSIDLTKNPYHHMEADSIVKMASEHALKAVSIYESWDHDYIGLSEAEIEAVIQPGFSAGLKEEKPELVKLIIKNRVQEIQSALSENDRRLSVCHTNLGVIYRQQGNYLGAVHEYEKALSLWDRNLDAENNLNKLLNKPLKKRTLIQKIFPPERGI